MYLEGSTRELTMIRDIIVHTASSQKSYGFSTFNYIFSKPHSPIQRDPFQKTVKNKKSSIWDICQWSFMRNKGSRHNMSKNTILKTQRECTKTRNIRSRFDNKSLSIFKRYFNIIKLGITMHEMNITTKFRTKNFFKQRTIYDYMITQN